MPLSSPLVIWLSHQVLRGLDFPYRFPALGSAVSGERRGNVHGPLDPSLSTLSPPSLALWSNFLDVLALKRLVASRDL